MIENRVTLAKVATLTGMKKTPTNKPLKLQLETLKDLQLAQITGGTGKTNTSKTCLDPDLLPSV